MPRFRGRPGTPGRGGPRRLASYPPPVPRFQTGLTVAVLLLASPGAGAPAKKPRPTPTATPTPVPILRAAGSCVSWVPGKNVVLAEVGTTGRVFRIDSSTRIETRVRVGARLRILYVEGPDGPIATTILRGPIVEKRTPTPGAGKN